MNCGSWSVIRTNVRGAADPVEKLFDALSHCAGLYPSANGAESGDAHPFSGIAPFGTGADSDDDEEGTEDAEEPAVDNRETKRVRTEN